MRYRNVLKTKIYGHFSEDEERRLFLAVLAYIRDPKSSESSNSPTDQDLRNLSEGEYTSYT